MTGAASGECLRRAGRTGVEEEEEKGGGRPLRKRTFGEKERQRVLWQAEQAPSVETLAVRGQKEGNEDGGGGRKDGKASSRRAALGCSNATRY